jgi:hypothetical protein
VSKASAAMSGSSCRTWNLPSLGEEQRNTQRHTHQSRMVRTEHVRHLTRILRNLAEQETICWPGKECRTHTQATAAHYYALHTNTASPKDTPRPQCSHTAQSPRVPHNTHCWHACLLHSGCTSTQAPLWNKQLPGSKHNPGHSTHLSRSERSQSVTCTLYSGGMSKLPSSSNLQR